MQLTVFHETWEDALREDIQACGGPKVVAAKLWPHKTPDAAHRLLLDCLNELRPERLDPERLRMLLKMAREKGSYAGINWLLRDLAYDDARPIEPQDKKEQLQRDFVTSVKSLQALASQIERLQS
jgi:hypothetical protein